MKLRDDAIGVTCSVDEQWQQDALFGMQVLLESSPKFSKSLGSLNERAALGQKIDVGQDLVELTMLVGKNRVDAGDRFLRCVSHSVPSSPRPATPPARVARCSPCR